MCGLLFLLLFNFALTSVTTDQLPTININVTRSGNGKFQTEILQNCCVINFAKPFKVMVYLPRQVKKKIKCFDKYNGNNITISKNLNKDREGYSVTIRNASAFMATDWQCGFYYSSNSSVFTRSFKVHVRGERPGPTLSINNNDNITSYQSELTIMDYDERAYHHYIDGEMTLFKCIGYKNYLSRHIFYKNKVTDEQLEVVGYREAVLHLRLTKEYDKSYLDCRVREKKGDGIINNTIRVFFQMVTALDIPKFMVNDMVLTPVSSSSPEFDTSNPNGTFVYDYYDNENVIIRTLTENNSPLQCNIDIYQYNIVENVKLNTTLKKHYNNLKLTCAMKDNRQQNDVITTLKFKLIESNKNHISGLSWANVLAQYKKKNEDIVIMYSYRGNRLQLTCHASDNQIALEFKESQVISEYVSGGHDWTNSRFSETRWFEMKPNYSRTTIKCFEIDNPPVTEVELIRDRPRPFEDIPETDLLDFFKIISNNDVTSPAVPIRTNKPNDSVKPKDSTTSMPKYSTTRGKVEDEDSTTSMPKYSTPSERDEDKVSTASTTVDYETSTGDAGSFFGKFKNLFLICAPVVAAITVIAITVCLIMKRLKQKRKEQAILSNIDYENLPAHNDGPMPIPPQWQCKDDDVTYSTPDVGKSVDDLYAKPLAKDQRSSNTAPIYAEAYDFANRPGADYVNTGSFIKKKAKIGKDNSNYSEVYQNNKDVNAKNAIKYANIDQLNETYAQVVPKTLRDCDNVGSLNERCYGNLNVTDDKPSNPYSEPGYAEIK